MISRLRMVNFQSHKERMIRFQPGVTTIVGPSDRGKSAIFRAIRACLMNEGAGEGMIKHGEDSYEVAVMIKEGEERLTVKRTRGKTGNLYHLGKEEFKAFGTSVPDPIREAVKMVSENFQGQHDTPFWLALPPGQVAKELNDITDLTLLDKVVARIGKEARAAKTAAEQTTASIRQHKKRLAELSWVSEASREHKQVKRLNVEYETAVRKARILRDMLRNAQELARDAETSGELIQGLLNVVALKIKNDETARDVYRLTKWVRALKAIKTRTEVPDTTKIVAVRKKADEISEKRRQLDQLLQHHQDKEEESCRINERIKEEQASLPKVCPVCNRKVKDPSQLSRPISTSPTSRRLRDR